MRVIVDLQGCRLESFCNLLKLSIYGKIEEFIARIHANALFDYDLLHTFVLIASSIGVRLCNPDIAEMKRLPAKPARRRNMYPKAVGVDRVRPVKSGLMPGKSERNEEMGLVNRGGRCSGDGHGSACR